MKIVNYVEEFCIEVGVNMYFIIGILNYLFDSINGCIGLMVSELINDKDDL